MHYNKANFLEFLHRQIASKNCINKHNQDLKKKQKNKAANLTCNKYHILYANMDS